MEWEKIFANYVTKNTMLYCIFESFLECGSQKFYNYMWYGY